MLLGTGDDLEIYHDGSNSRIVDAGTGQLIIQSNQFRVLNAAGSENLIDADENGAITLYYDSSTKLVTKSDGIDVTGEVQCDSLDVDGTTHATGDITVQDSTNFFSQLGNQGRIILKGGESGNFLEGYTNTGTQNVTITNGGKLLLGTTTEGEANADDLTVATSGNTGITVRWYNKQR